MIWASGREQLGCLRKTENRAGWSGRLRWVDGGRRFTCQNERRAVVAVGFRECTESCTESLRNT